MSARRAIVQRFGAAVLVWGLSSVPALAQTAPPKPAPVMPATVRPHVDVGVKIIHAQRGGDAVDPRLSDMLGMLKTLPFDSYTLLDEHSVRLVDGKQDVVALEGARNLTVSLLSHDAKEARVRVELVSGQTKVLETTVSIHRNKLFFLAVQQYKGGSLIVPISVRY